MTALDRAAPAARTPKPGRVRYSILAMLFIVTTVNYADRSTISIAGDAIQAELGISSVALGYVFSAFGWSYLIAQIPGGWLLDRFGSRKVYCWAIFLWSAFTMAQGAVGNFSMGTAVGLLFLLRLLVGLAEGPSFPGNSRIVAAWFPTRERGTAAAIFNSAQYFATVVFSPIMGWLVTNLGWEHVFTIIGGIGVVLSLVWMKVIYAPRNHPRLKQPELDHIIAGGAVVDMDQKRDPGEKTAPRGANLRYLRKLLTNRMMLGVYIGQYFINTLTWFFLTWFPVYLVQERGMTILEAGVVASLPALCGFAGGVLGGFLSDSLLRRGLSLTAARKIPIVTGLLLSTSIVICNYVDASWLVIGCMALSFFGKGLGALGWAVVADTSPKEIAGLSGGLFNTFGSLAAITTPIIIGYIINSTGSFELALVFVGASAVMAVVSYLVIVRGITRLDISDLDDKPSAVAA
ncbi:MFS transporter [Goodfellowiella coeruleoviolacea]|uniref:MFS transporter, ACS family, glucarate transporter n=1 Tax=Goodfellowiella coeruleoviolacea TaxID=334858 RepID=A0AAE3G9S2_9PSEU|nr:MFS transporter [Goodfellowiella coeruleoviolacea]MCP2164281.1 MFS transporter, ACS family, glucarate transporter [Goodfellowiella coeruleoviolacea]